MHAKDALWVIKEATADARRFSHGTYQLGNAKVHQNSLQPGFGMTLLADAIADIPQGRTRYKRGRGAAVTNTYAYRFCENRRPRTPDKRADRQTALRQANWQPPRQTNWQAGRQAGNAGRFYIDTMYSGMQHNAPFDDVDAFGVEKTGMVPSRRLCLGYNERQLRLPVNTQ